MFHLFTYLCIIFCCLCFVQWRRQRSKGARSFWGQKILQPGHPDALFSSVDNLFFSCGPQNTGRQRRFTVKIKQIKRSDMVTFVFSVHIITKAKQYMYSAGRSQGGARAVDLPARSFDLARPGVAPPLVSCSFVGEFLSLMWRLSLAETSDELLMSACSRISLIFVVYFILEN